MAIPDAHPDESTPGILIPGHKIKTPWLEPTHLRGIYTTSPGEPPHFAAVPTDARRGVMFAKLADFDFAFVLYGVKDFKFTHSQYGGMYDLKTAANELGPPGTYKNSNHQTFGKQVN